MHVYKYMKNFYGNVIQLSVQNALYVAETCIVIKEF